MKLLIVGCLMFSSGVVGYDLGYEHGRAHFSQCLETLTELNTLVERYILNK